MPALQGNTACLMHDDLYWTFVGKSSDILAWTSFRIGNVWFSLYVQAVSEEMPFSLWIDSLTALKHYLKMFKIVRFIKIEVWINQLQESPNILFYAWIQTCLFLWHAKFALQFNVYAGPFCNQIVYFESGHDELEKHQWYKFDILGLC